MPLLLSVNVDVDRVRANLSRQSGQPASDADVLRLLIGLGFHRWCDGWVAAERSLGMLWPNAVIDIRAATAEAAELVGSIERRALPVADAWN